MSWICPRPKGASLIEQITSLRTFHLLMRLRARGNCRTSSARLPIAVLGEMRLALILAYYRLRINRCRMFRQSEVNACASYMSQP